jgi:hypothetical protein
LFEDASDDKGNASFGVQEEVYDADDVKNLRENVAEEITVAPKPTPGNECVSFHLACKKLVILVVIGRP